jgi:hypothetical protein
LSDSGKPLDRQADLLVHLGRLDVFVGRRRVAAQQLDQRAAFVILITGSKSAIQAGYLVAPVAALRIDGLVRCNRIQPGAHGAPWLEVLTLHMDLEESRLERIFGHIGIAEVPPEIIEQLALITAHQLLKSCAITPAPVGEQQILIGPLGIRNGL